MTSTLTTIFDDLTARFFLNLPEEELSFERLFFQLEQAHWFYEDQYNGKSDKIPDMKFKAFCRHFFNFNPVLRPYLPRFDELFAQFCEYLGKVPVCGCIILNTTADKCIVVRQSIGKTYGFPKGKINHNEREIDCAVRESLEETGFDPASYINSNDFIQGYIHGKKMRLYIVKNVPEMTPFEPQSRKEIGDIRWVAISALPVWGAEKEKRDKRDKAPSPDMMGTSGNTNVLLLETKRQPQPALVIDPKDVKFTYYVQSFTERLRAWIKRNKPSRSSAVTKVGGGGKQITTERPQPARRISPRASPSSRSTGTTPGLSRANSASASLVPAASTSGGFPQQPQRPAAPSRMPSSSSTAPRRQQQQQQPPQTQRSGSATSLFSDEIEGGATTGWSPEDMFATNEALFGVKTTAVADTVDPALASLNLRDLIRLNHSLRNQKQQQTHSTTSSTTATKTASTRRRRSRSPPDATSLSGDNKSSTPTAQLGSNNSRRSVMTEAAGVRNRGASASAAPPTSSSSSSSALVNFKFDMSSVMDSLDLRTAQTVS